ncbi:hypothetical protein A9X02_16285 [Mycobacterium malmoense]|nr:hypothetical protein [Mycobacterium malmoense]OCB41226.1 hypothetical protein A9X02_16285 [Mycobacterium malmoense]
MIVGALGVVGAEQIARAQGDVGPPLGAGEVAAQIGQRLLDARADEAEGRLAAGLGRSPHVGGRGGEAVGPAGQVADQRVEMRCSAAVGYEEANWRPGHATSKAASCWRRPWNRAGCR